MTKKKKGFKFIPVDKFESLKRPDETPYYSDSAMDTINKMTNKGIYIPINK